MANSDTVDPVRDVFLDGMELSLWTPPTFGYTHAHKHTCAGGSGVNAGILVRSRLA